MILMYPFSAKRLISSNLFKIVLISTFFITIFSVAAFSRNNTDTPGTAASPAELSSWTAAPVAKGIALSWSTSRETNASNYVIERSTDGVEYTDAAMIFTSGSGNSSTKTNYSFTDTYHTGTPGPVYYRLRMVGMNGKYIRSAVQVVNGGK